MELRIKLNDYELIDDVTRLNLVDMLDTTNKEIEGLEAKEEELGEDMPDFLKVDLYDSRQHKKYLEGVLRYMSTKADLEEFGLAHICKW